MKRVWICAACALLCLSLFGCVGQTAIPQPEQAPVVNADEGAVYQRYQRMVFDLFDTLIIVMGYAQSHEEFERWGDLIETELRRLHILFDIYNDYDGVNNLKTVNDRAGSEPVEVDTAIIELLTFAQQAYRESGGVVNVALGSVLRIWSVYRQAGIAFPETAVLPSIESLQAAMAHTNIEDVVIDRENATVFLWDSEMSLDVGALAKGFAIQRAMELARAEGFFAGLINAGGDISMIGAPLSSGRDYWAVGVRDPATFELDSMYDVLHLSGETSVATSGNYQRFYMVDGVSYSHIIDPDTLMPADRHAGVTVIHPDAGLAEMLSTAIFILPQEEGARLLANFGGEGIWIFSDGSAVFTDGYIAISRDL
ncbi:MAG: FAD:protein FMN transferase [Oscillospiraceae bacterium]|nr:FAD:protein FMN transferase [Oscillospiraceae bacterium]